MRSGAGALPVGGWSGCARQCLGAGNWGFKNADAGGIIGVGAAEMSSTRRTAYMMTTLLLFFSMLAVTVALSGAKFGVHFKFASSYKQTIRKRDPIHELHDQSSAQRRVVPVRLRDEIVQW